MEQKVFSKELFDSVNHLIESGHLVDVTMKTELREKTGTKGKQHRV